MAGVLSQSQIDKLLSGLQGNKEDADALPSKEEDGKVKVYDFRSPKKFTKEQLEQMVQESRSYRELAGKIGYSPDGGSGIRATKEMLTHYKFNTEHFTGQGWNKDNFDYSRFQKGKVIKIAVAIDAIAALRGRKCEICGLETWNDQPIPLEVHHIDGDHLNNVLDNLKLTCPNCHALTENYRGKNIKKEQQIPEEQFVEALKTSPNIRQALIKLGLTAAGGNYATANELIIKHQIEHLIKK